MRAGPRQIPKIAKMLADEFGTASNIKNRVNRQARRRQRLNAATLPHPLSSPCSAPSRPRSSA